FYLPGPISNLPQNAQLVIDMARRLKIPAAFLLSSQVERGGLFTYAHDTVEMGKQTAVLVDNILRGKRPSAIPVGFSEKNTLVINLKTAREAGITIPESLLDIADTKIGK
ncbi:MAG: ABC transporter substrate binding protein, partial [Patescibacteria group bacterium]